MLVAWYAPGKQNGVDLGVVPDILDDVLSIVKGQRMNWQSSGVAVDTTGEPVCQYMGLDIDEPPRGDGMNVAEHPPVDTLADVQEGSVAPLPCLRVVTMPT